MDSPKLNTNPEYFYSVWNNSKCLSSDNQILTLQSCNSGPSQVFEFMDSRLVWHGDTNLCADMNGVSSGQSVPIVACEDASLWEMTDTGSLISQNLTLDINREELSIIAYGFHGGDNQQWINDLPTNENDSNQNNEQSNNDQSNNNDQQNSPWTEVSVRGDEKYGNREFWVPAAQNWVNSGLYLRKGQQAYITAEGSWQSTAGAMYGPEGHSTKTFRGCAEGELTARIGLYFEDTALTCIGNEGTITAHQDGIMFLGTIISTDLGDTYEIRRDAVGSVKVNVSSPNSETVPTIWYEDAGTYDYSTVSSGWVEIKSEHNIVTLPIATAIHDASELYAASKRIDDIYEMHTEIRGRTPYLGQHIRWFPDSENAPGWMLAGNPVRMDPALVSINQPERISIAGHPNSNNWGFAHELGHNFNFAGGDWYYTTYANLEAWPNIFSLYANERFNFDSRPHVAQCPEKKAAYLAKNTHDNGFDGADKGLCFLMEFTQRYGWQVWKDFYQDFNSSPDHGWKQMRDRMNRVTGEDTTDIFEGWKVPM